MIVDLPSTTTATVNRTLVDLRDRGGAVALGRVLTLLIVTDDGEQAEQAIEAANVASHEHPCRVLVLARGAKRAAARLDAQIRVGGDAGASEVLVLRMYGSLAAQGASVVTPLLLPDAPVVAWWPGVAPKVPADDPVGRLAQRRITDAAAQRSPDRFLDAARRCYADGDTDLAWTRLTLWRGLLTAALDQPPHEDIDAAEVVGASDSPSTELLAGWLHSCLHTRVRRVHSGPGGGISSVVLERRSGPVRLTRPDGRLGVLSQPGQPDRKVPLARRQVRDCLTEELRRLDPDEIYEAALHALPAVTRRNTPGRKAPS